MEQVKVKKTKTSSVPSQYSGKPLIEWGIEVVVMTILPSLFYALILYCEKDSIDFSLVLGNGDLLIAATIVSATSLFHVFWRRRKSYNVRINIAFYLSILCIFIGLLLFPGVKTGRIQYDKMAGFSVFSILCAYISSYAVERR